MTIMARRFAAVLLSLAVFLGSGLGAVASAQAPVPPGVGQADPVGGTPPRLSYVDGEASFWRPGASAWAPAQVNTALAPGDEMYTGERGNLELQVGGRAFVRVWGSTQLGLVNQQPDLLQVKVTAGHASLDLRAIDPGRTVEVDTPQAAFTIDTPGYYRVDVTPERTSFITRRSGRAMMTPAGGPAVAIASSEEVVLAGGPTPAVQTFVAPPLDVWDTWNYARTDELIDSMSARYVPSGVYGVDDLDHYGNWRVVPSYGAVWVPDAMASGWSPYSSGRWVADPYYGWTWVDSAPWGWAPYHHGRWVRVDGYWAWAPGPVVVRPVYAPALVAFFGAPEVQVTVASPIVGWVPLGWGEPLIPWWGSTRFVGRPWWGGWGGPRVVNNVVINRTTVVNIQNITTYGNASVPGAVVAVRQDAFGRRAVREARIAEPDVRRLEPVRGRVRATPDPSSFVAASGHAAAPPPQTLSRQVVGTRRPATAPNRDEATRERGVPGERVAPASRVAPTVSAPVVSAPAVSAPEPRIVPAPPKPAATAPATPRPPFGASTVERQRSPVPPRFGHDRPQPAPESQRDTGQPRDVQPAPPRDLGQPREPQPAPPREIGKPRDAQPAPPRDLGQRRDAQPVPPRDTGQRQNPQPTPPRALPGEPANRLSPGRSEQPGGHRAGPAGFDRAQSGRPRQAPATEQRSRETPAQRRAVDRPEQSGRGR
ncbi:MAG TPA: DUF6600 domain-containing protein [Methylomirabilota bacterium]|nr:DUF6600 domain-containing protein [Methylomirabilota bacterium]